MKIIKVSDTIKYSFSVSKEAQKNWGDLRPLPKPIYCDNELCKCKLNRSYMYKYHNKNYCSKWCFEQQELNNMDLHTIDKLETKIKKCKKCQTDVLPFRRKVKSKKTNKIYTMPTGVYPKLCKKCKKKYRKGKRKSKLSTVKKLTFN